MRPDVEAADDDDDKLSAKSNTAKWISLAMSAIIDRSIDLTVGM